MHERNNHFLHLMDRYVGIPLVFVLGLFKQKFSCQNFSRIALLKTAAIGDTILLSGIIQDIQAAFPLAKISLFTGQSNLEAAKLIKGIEVLPLPIFRPLEAIKKIRVTSYDLWIDFDSWPRINAVFSFFAKAGCKAGFKTKGQARHFVYDKIAEHKQIHELENYRALLNLFAIRTNHLPRLFLPIRPKTKQIVLHLFAGGSKSILKEWPIQKWLKLTDLLIERGYAIILSGSQKDRKRLEQVFYSKQVAIAAGQLSLEQTALLLNSSYAVVSVDTGIVHLAAALGCRVVSLYGPTSFARWGGVGETVIPISSQKHKPCLHLGFEKGCKSNRCMQEIEVSTVLEAIEKT